MGDRMLRYLELLAKSALLVEEALPLALDLLETLLPLR